MKAISGTPHRAAAVEEGRQGQGIGADESIVTAAVDMSVDSARYSGYCLGVGAEPGATVQAIAPTPLLNRNTGTTRSLLGF